MDNQRQGPNFNQFNAPYQLSPDQERAKNLGIASLIFGILSIVVFCIWPLSTTLATIGLIIGIIALNKCNKSGYATKEWPIIGMVLSALMLIISVILGVTYMKIKTDVEDNFEKFINNNQYIMDSLENQFRQMNDDIEPDSTFYIQDN